MTLVGNDFDMYLGQLGLLPNADMPTSGPDGEMAAGTNLGDWFSSGRDMMGLLEGDLSMFPADPGYPDAGDP